MVRMAAVIDQTPAPLPGAKWPDRAAGDDNMLAATVGHRNALKMET